MPEIFLSTQVSLDGYAAGPDGDLDWTDVPDDEVDELMAEQLRDIDAMIFGRTAYQLLGPYWQDGPTERPVDREHTELMNSVTKLVLSRGEPELTWGPAKRIGADLHREMADLKSGNGRPVAVFAGPQAANALLPYLDEVRLLVYPVLLGSGLALFSGQRHLLRLVNDQAAPDDRQASTSNRHRPGTRGTKSRAPSRARMRQLGRATVTPAPANNGQPQP